MQIKENGLPKGSGLYWMRQELYVRLKHPISGIWKAYPTHTNDVAEALEVKGRITNDLTNDKPATKSTKGAATISELLDDYIAKLERDREKKTAYGSDHAYKAASKINCHLRPFFGRIKANTLPTKTINEYQDKRIAEYKAAGKEPGSWICAVNGEWRLLHAAFQLGFGATPKKVNHIPKFPIDNKAEKRRRRQGFITEVQYRLLNEHLGDHLKPVLPFVVYAGVRLKELRFIRREQVDMQLGLIHLRVSETKNGEERDVPIVDVAVEPLRRWMEHSDEFYAHCQWLFHFRGKQLGAITTAWNNGLRRAGLRVPLMDADGNPVLNEKGKPRFKNLVRFHDTRRAAKTAHTQAGVTEADSMSVMGHKNVEVHRGYDQDKQAALRMKAVLNKHIAGTDVVPLVAGPVAKDGYDKIAALKDLIAMRNAGDITPEEFVTMKAGLTT